MNLRTKRLKINTKQWPLAFGLASAGRAKRQQFDVLHWPSILVSKLRGDSKASRGPRHAAAATRRNTGATFDKKRLAVEWFFGRASAPHVLFKHLDGILEATQTDFVRPPLDSE